MKYGFVEIPAWVSWSMILVATILIFPAFSIMLESQSLELWNTKVETMGILFTVGTLFWAFLAWVVLLILLVFGIHNLVMMRKNKP